MQILQGIAASPGVAIGEALIIDIEGFRVPRRFVPPERVSAELQRLDQAIAAVAVEMERNREVVNRQLGDQYGGIFGAHLQMLRDPRLYRELTELIQQHYYSAERAVTKTLDRYAQLFQQLGNSYLRERSHDILDIEKSLLRQLLGEQRATLANLSSPVIVLTHNLTPSETAGLDRDRILGFATEIGGASGHTAIVAKGMEIPAVVGLGNFVAELSGGEKVIVDGDHGRIVLQPDEATLAEYRREAEQRQTRVVTLTALRDLPAITTDLVQIGLFANIEFPREVDSCLERGAEGIGLYRTEFLYLGSSTDPTEEDHYRAYAEVVQAMQGKPVVIRTLDLGADKMGSARLAEPEENPFLGLRSIRLSLRNVPLFRTQLRAILRASVLGEVRVMFPLISNLQELLQAKMVLADAMEDLEDAGISFDRNLAVGMMVEVPSSAVTLDKFLSEVSFVSIGTNDLVQYTLAVDRTNNQVADAYRPTDPAVLRLLEMALNAADAEKIPVSVCGEMSGEVDYTMLLLGLGVRCLSVPPSSIPEVKKVCRSVSIAQCELLARRALALDNAREIEQYLREEVRKVVPDLVSA